MEVNKFKNRKYMKLFLIITAILLMYVLFLISNFIYHLYQMNKIVSVKTPEVVVMFKDYNLLYENIKSKMDEITIKDENDRWGSVNNISETNEDIMNCYNTLVIGIRNCYDWSKNNNQFMKYKETMKLRYEDILDLKRYSNSNFSCWNSMIKAKDFVEPVIPRLSVPLKFIEMLSEYHSQFSFSGDHYYILKDNSSFGIKDRSLYHEINNAIYTDFYNLLYNDYMTLKTVSALADFLYNEIDTH